MTIKEQLEARIKAIEERQAKEQAEAKPRFDRERCRWMEGYRQAENCEIEFLKEIIGEIKANQEFLSQVLDKICQAPA